MAHSRLDRLALAVGQWFGAGRSRVAPGTVGSLAALPLFAICQASTGWMYWTVTALVTLGGIVASQRCAQLLETDDPQSVVIDEVAGVMIALGWVAHGPIWQLALAWTLFRILDISKPWLIDHAQYLSPLGLGIMADDILAGMVAGAAARFVPSWLSQPLP